jgi:hypothetical protein
MLIMGLLTIDQNIIIEKYTAKAENLDEVLTDLTKYFCADSCSSSPNGCCGLSFYKQGVPEEFKVLQEQEAISNGWTKPGKYCTYHTDQGCSLTKYKPPFCLGYICGDLENHLIDFYQNDKLIGFLGVMKSIHHISLVKKPLILLVNMDYAILTGKQLINKS